MSVSRADREDPRRPLRVCYFGTYRKAYSRNVNMLESLRVNGVQVHECHATLWKGIEDRVEAASGGWFRPAFLLRLLTAGLRLVRRYLRAPAHDVLVVGYPGHLDVFLAKILGGLRGVPVVWDVFMSAYLVAGERGLHERSPLTAKVLKAVEGLALRVPDLLIQDTEQYVDWLHAVHRIQRHRFRLVPTGADDRVYRPPAEAPPPREESPFRVLYYGTYIPNHGVPAILDAARRFADETDIEFVLIGEGPDRRDAETYAAEHGLTHVRFEDWMEREDLVRRIHDADLCLGAFGTTPQSLMTVQNKVYECMAIGAPVLTGDSPAIRSQFRSGTELLTCERDRADSLASAIDRAREDQDFLDRVSRNGNSRYLEEFSLRVQGDRLSTILRRLAGIENFYPAGENEDPQSYGAGISSQLMEAK